MVSAEDEDHENGRLKSTFCLVHVQCPARLHANNQPINQKKCYSTAKTNGYTILHMEFTTFRHGVH